MIEADLSPIGRYIGAIQGIIDAVERPGYKGNFIDDLMDDIQEEFMVDTEANRQRLAHMFEWPDKQGGDVPPIPLFKLVRVGSGVEKVMNFDFLPSTKNVPLPDPERYGFKPSKLQYLSRHKFPMKALVMETQSAVTIKPKNSKRGLFIPDAEAPRGYYMTKKATVINPGGRQATGAFAAWWTTWFSTRAQEISIARTKLSEETFAANGRKAIRDVTTGRFSTGKTVSFGVADAKVRAEMEFTALSKKRRKK